MKTLLTQIVPLLDITSLNDADTSAVIAQLCERGITPMGQVAAVCVFPKFVQFAQTKLADTGIKIATVSNFPDGIQPLEQTVNEIQQDILNGADEIDIVMPYQAYIAGERLFAKNYVQHCKKICGHEILLKVILETGALMKPELISDASRDMIEAGADFIKTSTGKYGQGVTLDAVSAILHVIKVSPRRVGLKIAGGIRTLEDAMIYMQLAGKIMGEKWVNPHTFRIGASTLMDDIQARLK